MTAIDESREAAGRGRREFPQWSSAHAMGHFATGVTVVTSVGADGEPVGTTANAVSSLSLDPPLLLVCFDLSSATLEAIRSHGAFVVNVLGAPAAAPVGQLRPARPRRGLGRGTAPPRADRQPAAGRRASPSWNAPWSTACLAATTRSSSAGSGRRDRRRRRGPAGLLARRLLVPRRRPPRLAGRLRARSGRYVSGLWWFCGDFRALSRGGWPASCCYQVRSVARHWRCGPRVRIYWRCGPHRQ